MTLSLAIPQVEGRSYCQTITTGTEDYNDVTTFIPSNNHGPEGRYWLSKLEPSVSKLADPFVEAA